MSRTNLAGRTPEMLLLAGVAGQLAGAALLDLAVPAHGQGLTWQAAAGCLVTFGAVALGAGRPRPTRT